MTDKRPPGISDELWNAYEHASPSEKKRLRELYELAQSLNTSPAGAVWAVKAFAAFIAAIFRLFGFGRK